ncbi:hypothetical protein FA15DRAFT_614319 [Coprinopsis marcescibilis]|uniref:Peptidase M48 domain-containing protein n=1 Tax=Coprinopsis marcescibilis TaxID=230819 RepID=A0A5C3LF61_COPMA|nr:hypothetical protein FA15DRAFT_614319 [Coprinopsis marcescibilis]
MLRFAGSTISKPSLRLLIPSHGLRSQGINSFAPARRSNGAQQFSGRLQRLTLHKSTHLILLKRPTNNVSFHSTPRRQGWPLVALLAPILKASAAFEIVRTTIRIALTFLPAALLGRSKSARIIKIAHIHGVPLSDEKRKKYMKRLRLSTRIIQFLLFVPFTVFWATILASLEKTPLTGRWRTILLSPEEEDEIADQLQGQGWFNAVQNVLAQEGDPRIIPTHDWRYEWVRNTLLRLTTSIDILADELNRAPDWIHLGPDDPPLPPPAEHPLRPRPRAADMLRHLCGTFTSRPSSSPRPREPDNFNIVLVDSPHESNAFSYGFWPNGGSGIVIYSGFIDDIFARRPLEFVTPPDERSWFAKFFGVYAPPQPLPAPTEEQTKDLAVLLAHELSHLVLTHHLESLSSGTIVVPGALSVLADIFRVVIFPITMLFGPFVNDAVGQLGKYGSSELRKIGDFCTTSKQEIEADMVSTRILAYAGFDARDAVKFWEDRPEDVECHHIEKSTSFDHAAHGIVGRMHPHQMKRAELLRKEIARWEEARLAAAAIQI